MASSVPASFTPAVLSLNEVLAAPHALATLGLPLSTAVGDADVRAAYRAAALAFHPDKLSPAAQSDPIMVQSHGSAFIKVCEAFQAVKNADDRWKLIQQMREAEIWNEMKIKEAQDAQARAAPVAERQAAANRAPMRKTPPTATARAASAATASAGPAPSGAFPSFAGARFRPSAHTFRTEKAPPKAHATPHAAAPARPFGSNGAAAASARAAAAAASSSVAPSVGVTRVTVADAFRAELTRWKLHFQADMAAERDRSSQALVDRFGGSRAVQALQSQLGGVAIFTQAVPQQIRSSTSQVTMVSKQPVDEPAPTAAAAGSNAVTGASIPSRLQQMRDRQRGVQTALSSIADAPPAATQPAQPIPALSPAHTALLTSGARFRLRTVAVTPLSRPGAARASSSPASVATPVAISLWMDSSLTLLQYRLVTSPHSHPDGAISVSSLSSLRRLSKPVGDCWLSIVQRDGQSMSVEASSPEVRERWIAALEALVRSQR